MNNAEQPDVVIKTFQENIENLLSQDGRESTTPEKLLNVFKQNCFHYTDDELVNNDINKLLSHCARTFVSGGKDFAQFKAELKCYDSSTICGVVWSDNYFAYRCRTCGLTPTMSLCVECFINGNHDGHDFNKFKTYGGGTCDCGIPDTMKESGYCKHHGPTKLSQQEDPPHDLVVRLKILMPIYLENLLYACWSLIHKGYSPTDYNNDVLAPVLEFLNEILSCGWVAHKLCSNIMADKFLFKKIIAGFKSFKQYQTYESMLKQSSTFKFQKNQIKSQGLNHECLVDAYLLASICLGFPENVISFLIGLFTIESYKEVFTDSFQNHYLTIISKLLNHATAETFRFEVSLDLGNRIGRVSVQLCGMNIVALKMVKERDFHHVIVNCLHTLFSETLMKLDLHGNWVINPKSPVIQNYAIGPPVSDLINIFSHKSVVDYCLTDSDFVKDWTKILVMMQFMNFFVLKEGKHITFDMLVKLDAGVIESETSANLMWNIWNHYRNEENKDKVLKVVCSFVLALSEFLGDLGRKLNSKFSSPRKPLSFHLPLMRNVACFISLGLVYHNFPLAKLLEKIGASQIMRWLEETCNTLIGFQEVIVGYWVRNGQAILQSTMYYAHSRYCSSTMDLDILSFQICASVIPSATTIYILTDPTQLLKDVDFTQSKLKTSNKGDIFKNNFDKQQLAVEAWLFTLCWLLDIRNESTAVEDDMTKLQKEICCVLCRHPLKRSDLIDCLPGKYGINVYNEADVDSILNAVATYTARTFVEYSSNLDTGLYTFKPELWDTNYDPLYQRLRTISRRDASDAFMKYKEYYKMKENLSHVSSLWPPYRTPPPIHPQLSKLEDLLHCKDLTYILFSCLNMFVWSDTIVSEDSLALVIHLIRRSLSVPKTEEDGDKSSKLYRTRFPDNQYKVNNVWSNLRLNVKLYSESDHNDDGRFLSTLFNRFRFGSTKNQEKIARTESILSLLLKVHAKLHVMRLATGGKVIQKAARFYPSKIDRQKHQLDKESISFYENNPLVYFYKPENVEISRKTGIGVNWGDGVDFVSHLLDIIASKNDENSKALFELIEMIKNASTDNCDGAGKCSAGESKCLDVNPPDAVIDKRQAALDRRRRVIAKMAVKQKEFSNKLNVDSDPSLENANNPVRECVICQINSHSVEEKMVLLDMVNSAGCLTRMYSQSLKNSQKIFRKDYSQLMKFDFPVLSNGLIIQTCGHVVHQKCLDKYIVQASIITCPMCRREVHHLTPVSVLEKSNCLHSSQGSLMSMLSEVYNTPHNAFQNHIIEESITKYQACLISPENQACCLLRGQLELELIICLCAPDQYNTVIRRCIWTEFISYLRTLNANISSVIKFMDVILGTSFSKDILSEEELNDTSFVHKLLLQSPIDLFLNVIPSIWPNEEWINTVFKSCVILSYIKGLISIAMDFDLGFWNKTDIQGQSFNKHLRMILCRLQSFGYFNNADDGNTVSFTKPNHLSEYVTTRILSSLIPLLRIAAILKLRLLKVNQIPSNFPIQSSSSFNETTNELKQLCSYLNLSFSFSDNLYVVENIAELIDECKQSTWYQDLSELINCLVTDEFLRLLNNLMSSVADSSGSNSNKMPDLMNIGNEMCPPKLVDLPKSYDDLFNTYQPQKCDNKTDGHHFPDNGFCLTCGMVICFVCSGKVQSFSEHAVKCCSGTGLILEVNTSIIYVFLNNEIGQWGSVYLDVYGEEDLNLKRGRPLFISAKRFRLLEQQWLTHSFKHVIKTWNQIV